MNFDVSIGENLVMLNTLAALLFATLPIYAPLPPGTNLTSVEVEDFSEAEFTVPNSDTPVVQRGKLWTAAATLSSVKADADHGTIWAKIRPTLVGAGWAPIFEKDLNPYVATLRYQKGGRDAWASVNIYGADDIRISIIETAALKSAWTLQPPSAKPESVSAESGDFPYLTPLPGSKRVSSSRDEAPMMVLMPGESEPQAVAAGSIVKDYEAPAGLSNLAFVSTYEQALKQAGWTIVERSQGLHQTDVVLSAHYARNGRDVWSSLHFSGNTYSIRVADPGSQQLATDLAKNCHVPIYGVLFDFDKATIRPDSEAQLRKVADLFTDDPSLKLVIEGHTDNVGTAAHNQKLSEDRAKSVVAWLSTHGVAANRVAAQGFGPTRPIAPNDDEAGRAKNRRVELRKESCR